MYFISIPIIVGIILGIYITTNLTSDSMSNQPLITNSQLIKNGSPQIGLENATISIVEFGDYQCTYCKKFFSETEELILTNYVETGKVKMLFKDFIVVDEDSVNASSAAHCANDQKMFWQYHSALYNLSLIHI